MFCMPYLMVYLFLFDRYIFKKMDSLQNATVGTVGSGGNGILPTQGNDTTAVAATAVDDPKQNLNQVINSIVKTLGLLHQLYLTVSSFNTASQLPLLQRLYLSINLTFLLLFFYDVCFSVGLCVGA